MCLQGRPRQVSASDNHEPSEGVLAAWSIPDVNTGAASDHPANSSRRFFAFCKVLVRACSVDLNVFDIDASLFCSDTTTVTEWACSCVLRRPDTCPLTRPLSCMFALTHTNDQLPITTPKRMTACLLYSLVQSTNVPLDKVDQLLNLFGIVAVKSTCPGHHCCAIERVSTAHSAQRTVFVRQYSTGRIRTHL